ncbi:MAG: DNA methylase [Oscillospiraceae bacterium]|nr:DNA methylase [Oscillospiraceae bacterium]
MENRVYIAIDLKSFFASVECVKRGLDPLKTNLVVADESRTNKTICLAVTPSLKSFGIPGRPRLFEVEQKVAGINAERRKKSPGLMLGRKSCDFDELAANPSYALDYIVAPPQMSSYMEISTKVYSIYLRYVAPEDIHVYSIDEVFIDVTGYLKSGNLSVKEFATKIIRDIVDETGITATVGIGTNLYLCKVAMDIAAKRMKPDKNGARIAYLDENLYRRTLWEHTPITDFWRVGAGTARRLEQYGMFTMGDVARCSVNNEELLYKLFGVNAELLTDHAWGWENCTIADIKAYRPENNSLSSGQVLSEPYDFEKARLIVREMADSLALELTEKALVTDQIVLTVGYDTENLSSGEKRARYHGEIVTDHFGRAIPKPAHGSVNLGRFTESARIITEAVTKLYESVVQSEFTVRRICIAANHVVGEDSVDNEPYQLDLFTDYAAIERENRLLSREKNMQKAVLKIKERYGKNAIIRGMSLEDGATAISRNTQIGGHRA